MANSLLEHVEVLWEDSGKRIKKLAAILFVLQVIAFFGLGIFYAIETNSIWTFLVFAIVGWLLSWINGLCIYCVGEITECISGIEYNTYITSKKITEFSKVREEGSGQIDRLKKLREQNLITEQEYQKILTSK